MCFNFHTFESLTYTQVNPSATKTIAGNLVDELNIHLLSDPDLAGTDPQEIIDFMAEDSSTEIDIDTTQSCIATLYKFDDGAVLNNIELSDTYLSQPNSSEQPTEAMVLIQDKGNQQYYQIAHEQVYTNSYLRIHPAGKVNSLVVLEKFEVSAPSSDLPSSSISTQFNVLQPFDISSKRILCMFLLFATAWLLRPTSPLYKRSFNSRPFLICLGFLSSLTLVGITFYFAPTVANSFMNQYHQLAMSLAQGTVTLDLAPTPELVALNNPYDFSARDTQGIFYYWDLAYFNGSYFSYFGILPAILFHLPYYLVTGAEFNNYWGVAICVFAFAWGVIYLLKTVCTSWFKNTKQSSFLIATITFICGSWIVCACQFPEIYTLTATMALALAVWGIAFWIRSIRCTQHIHAGFALAGSFCVAATLLCRPQFMILALLGLIIFVSFLIQQTKFSPYPKTNSSTLTNIKRGLLALTPFILFASLAGCYNMMRFGSPFDFGAAYNLTTNDMTQRGCNFDRIALGLFYFLIQPFNMQLTEPYLSPTSLANNYHGITISENMYGGIFSLTPLLLFGLLYGIYQLYCLIKQHVYRDRDSAYSSIPNTTNPIMIFTLGIFSVLCGIIVAGFDANGAGLLMRYFIDFGFLISLGTSLALLPLLNQYTDNLTVFSQKGSSVDGQASFIQVLIVITTLVSLAISMIWLFQ